MTRQMRAACISKWLENMQPGVEINFIPQRIILNILLERVFLARSTNEKSITILKIQKKEKNRIDIFRKRS